MCGRAQRYLASPSARIPDTPLQRWNRHACCLRYVICNEGVPFRAHRGGVVSALRDFGPWQRPLTNRETNTRLNIYMNMSTTPENLVKIDLVVYETSLLQAIVKKERKTDRQTDRQTDRR